MAEIMAVEAIIEAEWLLKGYWTKPRFPFRTEKNAWSDIDILSYDPNTKHLVMSESKAHGGKFDVFGWNKYSEQRLKKTFLDFHKDAFFTFIDRIPFLMEQLEQKKIPMFDNFKTAVEKLTFQLVSNLILAEDIKKEVVQSVTKVLKNKINRDIEIEFKIDTTIEVFANIMTLQKGYEQGKRYGNPIIDLARELNRYIYPDIKEVTNSKEAKQQIKEQCTREIFKAMGIS